MSPMSTGGPVRARVRARVRVCPRVCVPVGLLIDEHGCHTHAHTQLSFNSLEIRAVIEIPAP